MSEVQHPKVVVIGAGSLFFGRKSIWQMVHSPHLNQGTLALVDTNPGRLERMARLAEMVVEETGVPLQLESASDWRDVLPGADFVVLSFAERTVYFRGIDCTISEKYGIRMCSGDTIGPGGIFRAMRELPVIMDCARDIERPLPGRLGDQLHQSFNREWHGPDALRAAVAQLRAVRQPATCRTLRIAMRATQASLVRRRRSMQGRSKPLTCASLA